MKRNNDYRGIARVGQCERERHLGENESVLGFYAISDT